MSTVSGRWLHDARKGRLAKLGLLATCCASTLAMAQCAPRGVAN